MKTWQQMLREQDPGGERMSPDAAARMRETVIRAARTAARPAVGWRMQFALASFAALVLMITLVGTRRLPAPSDPVTIPVAGERRQIQFATPNGTRIIWQINPDFSLGETIP